MTRLTPKLHSLMTSNLQNAISPYVMVRLLFQILYGGEVSETT